MSKLRALVFGIVVSLVGVALLAPAGSVAADRPGDGPASGPDSRPGLTLIETGAAASAARKGGKGDFAVAVERLAGVDRKGRVGMRLRVLNTRKWTATSVRACARVNRKSGKVVGIARRGAIRYKGRSACWILSRLKPGKPVRLPFQVKQKRGARKKGLKVTAWVAAGNSNPRTRRDAVVPAGGAKKDGGKRRGKQRGAKGKGRGRANAPARASSAGCVLPARLGVVFVTDDSGSMGSSDPAHIRSQAISVGLDQLPDGSLAAATTFSDYSWELFGASVVDPNTRPLLKKEATSLVDYGLTDYDEAFLGAQEELAKMPTADRKAVIFLSDGFPSYSGFTADQAIGAAGVPIYSIGLGVSSYPEAKAELAGIAARSGGHYFEALSAGQLQSIFARIISSLTCGAERITETFALKPGESRNVPFTVGPGDSEFRALASWSSGAVTVAAQRPNATTMTPTTLLPGEAFTNEPTYALLSGTTPLVGGWALTVTAPPSNLNDVSVSIDVFSRQLPAQPAGPAPIGRRLDPCIESYKGGKRHSKGKFGGKETVFDRTESLYQVCAGFGAPEGLDLTPEMKCALIAAGATFIGPPAVSRANLACDTVAIANALQTGDWLGAAAGKACGYFSDVFAAGVAIVAAGATSPTGPGAGAVGLVTYRALSGGLKLACGGLLDGGAAAFGAKLEADHQTNIALDVIREGKCISHREQFNLISWRAVACP